MELSERKKELVDRMIKKFGFEDKQVIDFCKFLEVCHDMEEIEFIVELKEKYGLI